VRIAALVAGCLAVGGIAYAATNWTVGLDGESNGQAQSASVANLTVTAVASPSAVNLVYPGGYGDAVVTIQNTGTAPVTITAVSLPARTVFAAGYSNSTLTTATTCTGSVSWRFATTKSGTSHTLTTPLTVGADSTLTVTLANDITMATNAPASCRSNWFKMPALIDVTATAGAGTETPSPATSGWTA
jgi:archaellum component FlaG (FlaF/FlaG flagellin family)